MQKRKTTKKKLSFSLSAIRHNKVRNSNEISLLFFSNFFMLCLLTFLSIEVGQQSTISIGLVKDLMSASKLKLQIEVGKPI
jgi:hypothetical protein